MSMEETTRESIEFDVLFVGGGPACLAGAVRLMQLAKARNTDLEVALIEKGSEIGAHSLSGAVMDHRVLAELIPDYLRKGFPMESEVRKEALYFLTRGNSFKIPYIPKYMHNTGFPVVSLSRFTKWLAGIAEDMGVNIFTGFSGNRVVFDSAANRVKGVTTGDKGLSKDGVARPNFEPGMNILAKATIFGEGARGSLFRELAEMLNLSSGKAPQVYETGIKEVIQLPERNRLMDSGVNVLHTLGHPLDLNVPGGGFVYEMSGNRASVGFLTGLSYSDPMLDPYEAFIEFKRHPLIAGLIEDGEILEQGARTVSTGGWYSIPRPVFNGGMVVGASAALHNGPALKGVHIAMESGMAAAEACMEAIKKNDFSEEILSRYTELFNNTVSGDEIFRGRNFYQALSKPSPIKFIYLGAQYFSRGKGFRDPMRLEEDRKQLVPAAVGRAETPENDPAYDGKLYVDRLTGVYFSKTAHREDQPNHIVIRDPNLCAGECRTLYRNPCTRFCPGGVYEIVQDSKEQPFRLKLNPANCLHCKTCEIKDPFGNIRWTCPEGGGGPGYTIS